MKFEYLFCKYLLKAFHLLPKIYWLLNFLVEPPSSLTVPWFNFLIFSYYFIGPYLFFFCDYIIAPQKQKSTLFSENFQSFLFSVFGIKNTGCFSFSCNRYYSLKLNTLSNSLLSILFAFIWSVTSDLYKSNRLSF